MNLSSLRARLDHLLEQQGPPDGPPSCVVILPTNAREPDEEDGKPLPRIAWRNRHTACVLYDPIAGTPTDEDVRTLVGGAL